MTWSEKLLGEIKETWGPGEGFITIKEIVLGCYRQTMEIAISDCSETCEGCESGVCEGEQKFFNSARLDYEELVKLRDLLDLAITRQKAYEDNFPFKGS